MKSFLLAAFFSFALVFPALSQQPSQAAQPVLEQKAAVTAQPIAQPEKKEVVQPEKKETAQPVSTQEAQKKSEPALVTQPEQKKQAAPEPAAKTQAAQTQQQAQIPQPEHAQNQQKVQDINLSLMDYSEGDFRSARIPGYVSEKKNLTEAKNSKQSVELSAPDPEKSNRRANILVWATLLFSVIVIIVLLRMGKKKKKRRVFRTKR